MATGNNARRTRRKKRPGSGTPDPTPELSPAIEARPVRIGEHWYVTVPADTAEMAEALEGKIATVRGHTNVFSATLAQCRAWCMVDHLGYYTTSRVRRGALSSFRQQAYLYDRAHQYPVDAARLGLTAPFTKTGATGILRGMIADLLDLASDETLPLPPKSHLPETPASFRQAAHIFRLCEAGKKLAVDHGIEPVMDFDTACTLINALLEAGNAKGAAARPGTPDFIDDSSGIPFAD